MRLEGGRRICAAYILFQGHFGTYHFVPKGGVGVSRIVIAQPLVGSACLVLGPHAGLEQCLRLMMIGSLLADCIYATLGGGGKDAVGG